MGKLVDLTGKTFGRLTVLNRAEKINTRTSWNCICSCGNKKIVTSASLISERTKSCGCLHREIASRPYAESLEGHRIGRLIALRKDENCINKKNSRWLCQCDCGIVKSIPTSCLKKGTTRSCGCLRREIMRNAQTKHNGTTKKEYYIWINIKMRCKNNRDAQYPHYGARGIKICEEWEYDFARFLEDVGSRPTPKHSLDRINNDGDYEPGNCRWATAHEQARNRRGNVRITAFGETKILKDWATILEIGPTIVKNHLNKGKSMEDIIVFRENKLGRKLYKTV